MLRWGVDSRAGRDRENEHQGQGKRKHETSKTVRETEAEAVAFAVCKAKGLDSTVRSADYIKLYRGSTVTLSESLDFIQKTAAEIIEALGITSQRRLLTPEAA